MTDRTTKSLYRSTPTGTAVILASLFLFSACGQQEKSSGRSKSYGTTTDGNGGSPQQSTANQNNNTTTGTDSSLASYLFSLADAQGISALVLPYVESSTKAQDDEQDPSQNSNRDFIAGILDDMMNLKPHDPGRDFTVVVSADSSPNASALNQSLVINKGIINFAPGISLAMVICHEVAHSTRNHSSQAEKYMNDYENKKRAASDKLDAELQALVAKAWNKETGKYNHTAEDFKKIKPIWDAFWSEFIIYQKKLESEADVVGGRICANSGFSTIEVESGFNKLFDLFVGVPATAIKEGSYSVKESELGKFLQSIYGDDPHPSDAERREQITRVKDAFVQGASQAIADKWKTHFTEKTGAKLAADAPLDGYRRSAGEDIMARHTQKALTP